MKNKSLTDILSKEKAFEHLATSIDLHFNIDPKYKFEELFANITKDYFGNNENQMKTEWLQYQHKRYL